MPFQYEPPVGPLPILHQDKDVVVVNKPSGCFRFQGGEALQDGAQTRIAQQFGRVYSVHRLDMNASGILMFALRRKAERHLKAQFRLRTVQKRYEALVFGDLEPAVGVIELPLPTIRSISQSPRCVRPRAKPRVRNTACSGPQRGVHGWSCVL